MKRFFNTIISIALIISLLSLSGCYFSKTNSVDEVESLARSYLCEKYSANEEDFELIKYQEAHIAWVDTGELFYNKPEYVDCSFEYVYNGRNFFVIRDKWHFYDDYQLEDVEEWCTKWLQDNVCEYFIGFELQTEEIIYYEKQFKNPVITENDAAQFLNTYAYANDYNNEFYFFDPQWNEKAEHAQKLVYYDNLRSLLSDKIDFKNDCYCRYSENAYEIKYYRSSDYEWCRFLTFNIY